MRIVSFGNWKEKGYLSSLFLSLPGVGSEKVKTMIGDEMSTKYISFPTHFLLTSSSYYVKIEVAMFGFGLIFEIHTRSGD